MAKKIYDIKPPKVAKKTERTSSGARKKTTVSVAKPVATVRQKERVKFPWKVFVSVSGWQLFWWQDFYTLNCKAQL
jgi:hypothetical protein